MNSRRFADTPEAEATDMFVAPVPVSLAAGLRAILRKDGYRSAMRGLASPKPGGSRDSSVYRGLSAGPRVFLPYGHRCPATDFLSPRYGGTAWRPSGTSAFAAAPAMISPSPLREEGSIFAMVPDSIWRRGRSAGRLATPSWAVCPRLTGSTVILGSAGLPAGGRIPPGGYPSAVARAMAGLHAGKSSRFPVHRVGEDVLRGVSTKFVNPCSWMFLFQGFPEAPFS